MTAEAIGGLEYSPRRGCVANTAHIQAKPGGAPAPGPFCLATTQISPAGRLPVFTDRNGIAPPPLLASVARGGGRSKGGALAPPFHVSPRDTGEADWFFHFWTKEVFHAVNYIRYKAQGDICR